jgi:cardiolipin synthase
MVGSSNFDSRSSEINEELDVVVYDEKFARQMETIFEKDLRDAREYTLQDFKSRSWWERSSEWLMLPFRSQL